MFEKMRYVYAVYREGSFTKAAEKLFISQPSLSAAIRRLEEELGAPLFERGTKVRPTQIGLSYIHTAERMMELEERFRRELQGYCDLEQGELAVGGSNLVSSYILPGLIGRFGKQYPGIQVTMWEENSRRLAEQLEKEQVDLIIDSFDEQDKNLVYYELRKEKILLAVPAEIGVKKQLQHLGITPESLYEGTADLSKLPEIPIGTFKEEKFILLKSGNSMYGHAMQCFQQGGMTPEVCFYLDQLITSYTLCAGGGGLCFVTDTMFRLHRFRDDVLLFRVAAGERTLCVAAKRSREDTPAMRRFVETAIECYRSPQSPMLEG